MNAPLRKVGVVMMILFGLLFLNLNYVQVYKADDYTSSDQNAVRIQISEYDRQRGFINADGAILARSTPTDDTLKYVRSYPLGAAYAHVVGYKSVAWGMSAVEKWQNDFLAGNSDEFVPDRLLEAVTGQHKPGGNVLLTLRKSVQDAAYKELLNNNVNAKAGAVVAIDPATGAILAMVSTPSFNPNLLTVHDNQAALQAKQKLQNDPNKPLLDRAIEDRYPPGSTFKVIVATAALEAGLTPQTMLQGGDSYQPPGTSQVIHNSPGVVCPDQISLADALRVSCNTAFARLGVEKLGADKIKQAAQSYGFESVPTFDSDDKNIMNVVESVTGTMQNPGGQTDLPALAQSCIGQRDVAMTPLQGALVAATVANNGVQMKPYLIDTLQDSDLRALSQTTPSTLRTPLTPEVAASLREMMFGVVNDGTGKKAQIDGYDVGGKTGTAQNGDNADHGWFIGFAMKDGRPIVAVAVFLQNAGAGGSSEATRIGGQVMKAAIAAKASK
jgi:peptidoglycan glycosyltransferase